MIKVRCRYGPSPSGNLHVGSARTALFIYLFAKSQGGEFILRIDDTDLARSNYDHTKEAVESLKWLGIRWDEGPIYQSRRFDIYKRYIQQLIDTGHAYYEETEKGKAVRFKMPKKIMEFEDLIHGTVKENMAKYNDFVIQRSDGTPTYQIATVVDDHLMGITHLPRGNDLFRSTHRQNVIYDALGWRPPLYAHIPLVVGNDTRKLSKRHGASSVLDFRNNLYLPEALLNYLSMLGWAPKNKKEILSLEEMEKYFDYRTISKDKVVFSISKLNWLNRQYLKRADLNDIAKKLFELLVERGLIQDNFDFDKFKAIVKIMTPRYYSNCDEFINNSMYFYKNNVEYDYLAMDFIDTTILQELEITLSDIKEFSHSNIDSLIRDLSRQRNILFGNLVQNIRYIATGRKVTPDIVSVLSIMGKQDISKRIRKFIEGNQSEDKKDTIVKSASSK